MKLLRVGPVGEERPALLDGSGVLRDLTGAAGELPPLETAGLRIGPPVARIGKVVCVGLKYHDHARETGAAIPREPILSMKAPDTVVGAYDDVLVPRGSVKHSRGGRAGRAGARAVSAGGRLMELEIDGLGRQRQELRDA